MAHSWEAPGWHSRRRTEPRLVTSCRGTHGGREMPPKRCKRWSGWRAVLGFGGSTRFVTRSIAHPGGFWKSAASCAKASSINTSSSPTCGQANCLMSSAMLCSCNAEIGMDFGRLLAIYPQNGGSNHETHETHEMPEGCCA